MVCLKVPKCCKLYIRYTGAALTPFLLPRCSSHLFSEHEEIFVNKLYVIKHGLVGISGRAHTSGAHFGEEFIVFKHPPENILTVLEGHCMTFVSCLSIDSQDLWELLDTPMFPQTHKLVLRMRLLYMLRDYVRSMVKMYRQRHMGEETNAERKTRLASYKVRGYY
jgi:hypothetical protein